MLEGKDSWQNKFNNTDLDNEQWLEPSEGLFDAIEEQIYGKEEHEKKAIVLFPYLLLIGILLAVLAFIFLKANMGTDTLISEVAKSEKAVTTDASGSNTKDKATSKISAMDQSSAIDQAATLSSSAETQTTLAVSDLSKSNETKSIAANNKSSLNKLDSDAKNATATQMPVDKVTSVSQKNNTISTPANQPTIDAQPEFFTLRIGNLDNLLEKKAILSHFDKLQKGLKYLERNQDLKAAQLSATDIKPLPSKSLTRKQIYIGVGGSITHHLLNANFQSAVNPADFTQGRGEGHSLNLGYAHKFPSNIKLFSEVDYNKTTFTSGHNSTFNYMQNAEGDPVVLTMATPLGFVEGTAFVTSNGQQEAAELILDLHNEHSYSSVALNVGLGYEFELGSSSFLEFNGGFGAQHLFGLENTLAEVVSSDLNFTATAQSITANQQTINKLIPRSFLGMQLGKIFSNASSVSLSYRWVNGLKPIHKQDDLSTNLSRHNLTLQFGRYF